MFGIVCSLQVKELNEDHELQKRSGQEIHISSPDHASYYLGMRAGLFTSLTPSAVNSDASECENVQIHISELLAICILRYYIIIIIVLWIIVNWDTDFYANLMSPSGYYWEYDSNANKVVVNQVSVKNDMQLLWSKYSRHI